MADISNLIIKLRLVKNKLEKDLMQRTNDKDQYVVDLAVDSSVMVWQAAQIKEWKVECARRTLELAKSNQKLTTLKKNYYPVAAFDKQPSAFPTLESIFSMVKVIYQLEYY